MSKTSPTAFIKAVQKLLAERAALRPLLSRYKPFLDFRNYNSQRSELEGHIAAIITSPFSLDEQERLGKGAHAEYLATCVLGLRSAFQSPRLQDNPLLAWDGQPVPGIDTTNWPQPLKQRLLDLCGPLDNTLARMMSA